MGDMLTSAASALTTYQRALATTSHNIANVNTEGYSRQRVDLETRIPQNFSFGSVGSGVNIQSIRRTFDQFVSDQINTSTAAFNQLDAYNQLSSRIDNLLADPSTGISASLSGFFNSLQDLADDPASLPARQVFLSEADGLVSRLGNLDSQLDALDQEVNTRISSSVDEINGLTGRIAELNQAITNALGQTGGAPPNDLLDQRDLAITQLNEFLRVTTTAQDDGSLSVFVSSGDALVLNDRAFTLSATTNEFNPTRREVTLNGEAASFEISDQLNGGSLGGTLSFRSEVLDPAYNQLGRISLGLATAFNEQHRDGMDLTGALGEDFFTIPDPQVSPSSNNTGNSTFTVTIADVTAVTTDNYRIRYDGTDFNLFNDTTGELLASNGTGSFVVDGLSIAPVFTADPGDEFLIQPTAGTTGGLAVAISDPAKIAAAAPTRSLGSISNLGDATISPARVVDVDDADLLVTHSIVFDDPPTTYSVDGNPSVAYTSGDPIVVAGTEVVISGTPAAGDTFTIESNAGGIGDNSNALLLADVETTALFDGGTTTLSDGAVNLLGEVAVATRTSEINRQSQQTLLEQNIARREAVSGVNLDEEAANMLRYQQAYQAAAQAVTVANTIFQTLLGAFR